MTKVWEWSKSSGNDRMVLLALADHSDDDGICFPGIARIAKKSRISERTVQRCFKNLMALGELKIEENMGIQTKGGKTNRFTIKVYGGDKLTGGDKKLGKVVTESPKGGDTAMSPKSSVESSVNHKAANAPLIIPENLKSNPEFMEQWEEWKTYYRERNHRAPTPRSLKANLKDCEAWGPVQSILAIKHSIKCNYQAIFPAKGSDTLKPKIKVIERPAWLDSISLITLEIKQGGTDWPKYKKTASEAILSAKAAIPEIDAYFKSKGLNRDQRVELFGFDVLSNLKDDDYRIE